MKRVEQVWEGSEGKRGEMGGGVELDPQTEQMKTGVAYFHKKVRDLNYSH